MKRVMIYLLTFGLIFGMTTLASAASATVTVNGNDLVVSVDKVEVPSGVSPQVRGVFTGWENQPMTDSGSAWTLTVPNGAMYAGAAEFCVDLGGEQYLPEKASDFKTLIASGQAIFKPATGGHNYKF